MDSELCSDPLHLRLNNGETSKWSKAQLAAKRKTMSMSDLVIKVSKANMYHTSEIMLSLNFRWWKNKVGKAARIWTNLKSSFVLY